MTSVRYILMEDALSVFHDRKGPRIYGKKGQLVTEVSTSDTVVIVEDKDGERFPASVNKLQKL